MKKVFIIARKELISTFRQRNTVLIMFLSPIVMVTIIGLAFSGLGSGDMAAFEELRIAVVNQDTGFRPQNDGDPSLFDQALAASTNPGSVNWGNQLAAILLSQPQRRDGLTLDNPSCPLLPDAGDAAASGSLGGLFDAVAVADPAAARASVASGDLTAAVIIPPGFSEALASPGGLAAAEAGAVEVYANAGTPIAASIVRAVVENLLTRIERMIVATRAIDQAIAAQGIDVLAATTPAQPADATLLEPLGCLLMPQAGNVRIQPQPVDQTQTYSVFAILMVTIGGAQAVFFALFTGVFGINAIYEDRIQGTLQRLLVTPTPSGVILAGRLLGNLVIVMAQLLILLFAFTVIASLVEREWLFIWGTNLPALLVVVIGLSLFTTGLGVLIVGLARTSEQVQIFGPIITILLSVLAGSFGFLMPIQVSQLSPVWWGLEAMRKLAANEADIGLHLMVLYGVGVAFAGIGTYFFRRRMGL